MRNRRKARAPIARSIVYCFAVKLCLYAPQAVIAHGVMFQSLYSAQLNQFNTENVSDRRSGLFVTVPIGLCGW